MKVFYGEGSCRSKVNFVDENNVLVGFDNEDDCCAQGGWFISDKQNQWLDETFKEEAMELDGWNFDTNYFEDKILPGRSEYEEGGAVQFRLINGDEEKFLTLYNFHNGYYARGFDVTVGGQQQREGSV